MYVVVSTPSLLALFLQLKRPFAEAPGSPQYKTQMCHKTLCEFCIIFDNAKDTTCSWWRLLDLLCKSIFKVLSPDGKGSY